MSTDLEDPPTNDAGHRSRAPDAPIHIDSDSELVAMAAAEGWPGDGTPADPYRIGGLKIDGTGRTECIYVGNVSLHFEVVGNSLSGTSGVLIHQCGNCTVSDNDFSASDYYPFAIKLSYAQANVSYNTIANFTNGIQLVRSSSEIFGNNLTNRSIITLDGRSWARMAFNTLGDACRLELNGGTDNLVVGNRFEEGSGGISSRGTNARISNNVFQGGRGISLDEDSLTLIEDNTFDVEPYAGCLFIDQVKNCTLRGNFFTDCGISFSGYQRQYAGHSIDLTNKVNGRSVLYLANEVDRRLSGTYGQIILASCKNISVTGLSDPSRLYGIIVALSEGVSIVDNGNEEPLLGYLSLYGSAYTTVQNNTIQGPIHLDSSRCSLIGNRLGPISVDGILNMVANNSITSDKYYGILDSLGDSNTYRGNVIRMTDPEVASAGLSLYHVIDARVHDNRLYGAGIEVDNGWRKDWWTSIQMDDSNTVDDRPILWRLNRTGFDISGNAGQVILSNCSGFSVSGLRLDKGTFVVQLGWCDNGTIRCNRFNGGYKSIVLSACENITVEDNLLNDVANPILVIDCHDCHIISNYVIGGRLYGIVVRGSAISTSPDVRGIVVSRNYLYGLGAAGIYLHGLHDSHVNSNEIVNCSGKGLWLADLADNVPDTADHNYFLGNNRDPETGQHILPQADGGTRSNNRWDDGTEGNYWSDYRGKHPDATDIGGTWSEPYLVSTKANISDDHPLVEYSDVVPPLPDAGGDVVIGRGETHTLDASGSIDNVGITGYEWSVVDDGGQAMYVGVRVDVTFDTIGRRTATLRVVDADGNENSCSVVLDVRDRTPPVARAGEDVTIDQGGSVELNASGSSDDVGIVSYEWSFDYGGERVVRNTSVAIFWFEEPGVYRVRLRVADGEGNWDVDELNVTVLDTEPPVAFADEDVEIDQHGTVRFDGTRSHDNVGVVGWRWTFMYVDGPVERLGAEFEFTFDASGEYLVALNVTDAAGNWAVDTLFVRVRDLEPPSARAGEDVEIGQGEYARFDGSASDDNVGVHELRWEFQYRGRNETLHGTYPDFLFEDVGTYAIRLTVLDEAGNQATDEVVVTVLDTTAPEIVALAFHEMDQHQVLVLDAEMSRDNVGVVAWTWVFEYNGTDVILTGARVTYRFDLAGAYAVNLTVVDARGNSNSTIVVVTVRDIEPPNAVATGVFRIRAGTVAHFDGNNSTDNVGIRRWLWDFMYDSRNVQTTTSAMSYLFSEPGDYYITLSVWDEAGLMGTTTFKLVVEDADSPPRGLSIGLVIVLLVAVLSVVGLLYMLYRRRRARPEGPLPPGPLTDGSQHS